MPFESINDVRHRFGISEDASLEDIRKELKELIRKNHADVTGGDFNSPEQRATYHAAREAAKYIDDSSKQGLVVLPTSSELSELVKLAIQPSLQQQREAFDLVVKEMQSKLKETSEKGEQESRRDRALSKIDELETYARQHVEGKVKEIRFQNYVPRITFSLLVAILTILWLLPQRISGSQALQQLIDVQSASFVRLWVASLVLAVTAWLVSWYLEALYKRKYTVLNRDDYQERLFTQFIDFIDSFPPDALPQRGFSKSNLTIFIYMTLNRMGFLRQYSPLNLILDEIERIKVKFNKKEEAFREEHKLELANLESRQTRYSHALETKEDISNFYKNSYMEVTREIEAIEEQAGKYRMDRNSALRELFLEFKQTHMTASLFPQVTQTFDPEIAAQLAEIMLEKAVLKGHLKPLIRATSIDDWYEW